MALNEELFGEMIWKNCNFSNLCTRRMNTDE